MMQVTEIELGDDELVILGPCPGCDNWQIQYTWNVCFDFERPDFERMVEACLQDHYHECPPLQALVSL